ncbi:MAG: hypothetical protein EXS01_04825 [Phycisphaerales bacterium]|nr:hypothetical protein [Phycisphaerales bacterium]
MNPKRVRLRWVGIAAFLLFAIFLWIGGTHSAEGVPRALPALARTLFHLPGPLSWLLSAGGWGLLLARVLGVRSSGWTVSLALGVCAMLFIDAALGTLGFFGVAGAPGGFVLLAPGVYLLWREFDRGAPSDFSPTSDALTESSGSWLAWTIAPAIATLLLAAASAPGWLWSTEFGGYDALSYHLQLPREWMASGRITALPHNAYALLPSFMESAYLHLMVMRSDAQSAALDAQILHALLAGVAALTVGALARVCHDRCWGGAVVLAGSRQSSGRVAGWCAGGILLGLPWIIVVGSLAYNEMPMVLAFAAALTLLMRRQHPKNLTGIALALALLCAAAIGSKLTGALFVALPIALGSIVALVFLIYRGEARGIDSVKAVVVAALAGIALLSPWWLRNGFATGSPFFPIFGDGGLTAAQAAIFHAAHGAIPLSEWGSALFDEWFFFGLTASGPTGEPWRPFWSILASLGLGCGLLLLIPRRSRLVAAFLLGVLVIQLACWLWFTHAKSRFLIPTAVPCAVLVGMAIAHLPRAGWMGRTTLAAILLAWCSQPFVAYITDGPEIDFNHSPATGIGMEPLLNGQAGGDGLPAVLQSLPRGARVVTIGCADVFWWRMIPTYSTVWNSNPIQSAITGAHGDSDQALETLRTAGYTHLVINGTMLRVWRNSEWLDPAITPESINQFQSRLKPIGGGQGVVVYSLAP